MNKKQIFIESIRELGLSESKVTRIMGLLESLDDLTEDDFNDAKLNKVIDKFEDEISFEIDKKLTNMELLEDKIHKIKDNDSISNLIDTYKELCDELRNTYAGGNTLFDERLKYFDTRYGSKLLIHLANALDKILDELSDYDSELYHDLISHNITPESVLNEYLDVYNAVRPYAFKYLPVVEKQHVTETINNVNEYLN